VSLPRLVACRYWPRIGAATTNRVLAEPDKLTYMVLQEPDAAVALVNANKVIQASTTPTEAGALKVPDQRHHQRVASASAVVSRTASPARFDNFGRRILTPPITRSNSTQGSIPGTPKRESDVSVDGPREALRSDGLRETDAFFPGSPRATSSAHRR